MIIVFLVLVYGIFRKQNEIIRLALLLTVLISLITIVVSNSGEGASQLIEGEDGVNEEMIDPHEEMAEIAVIVMYITGGISLAGLIIFRGEKNIPLLMSIVYLILMISVISLMGYTAHLGGQIKHPEIIHQSK
ncbi:MAG TPA: hypothetical protein PLG90_02725 [Ignavibacteria bacterium]|nr:hypothetical protein [Ignavibacteria bacterium]